MSTTVYALLFMALLNGKAPVSQPQETTLALLPTGSAGKVSLALRMDERLETPRPQSLGLVGEYRDGRFVRVDRGWREVGQSSTQPSTQLSIGVRRQF